MSTADKLHALFNTKEAIKQAIINKGVEVADDTVFADYADKISAIEVGGGTDEFLVMRTNNYTDMSHLFYGYKGANLDVSNFDTNMTTTMFYMFSSCNNLIELDLSTFSTNNVTVMNYMFSSCPKLTTLNLSNFNMNKINNVYNMFYDCSSLHTLRLDNCSNDTINKIINSSFFPTEAIDGVQRKIYVNPDNIGELEAPENWIFVDLDGNEIELGEPEIYQVGYYRDNADITEATTMVNETHTDLSEMFYCCTELTTINNIELWDTSNITNMSSMFFYCRSLETLDLSSFTLNSAMSIVNMFSDCSSLETLDIRNFDMGNVELDCTDMFNGCDNLCELRLDNCDYNTIDRIISELPTNAIEEDEQIPRKIYVNPDNLRDLTAPTNWVFVDSDGNEIVPDEGGEELPVCEYCGEEGCDGSCTYCPNCGNLNEECTCTCPDCGELLRECICGLEEEPPVCEFCGDEGCDGSCQEGGEEE